MDDADKPTLTIELAHEETLVLFSWLGRREDLETVRDEKELGE